MKRYLLIISALLLSITLIAQPSWVKKTSKSVFTLKTFSEDGTLLGSATGFFVADDGVAVSSFSPFKGASRAIIIDAAGREYPVSCMLGANETYDVAKFKVGVKKSQSLAIVNDHLTAGTAVWLLPYREVKHVVKGTVNSTETFNQTYSYYTLDLVSADEHVGAPLLNDAGEVVAILQPASGKEGVSYAVSARFADSLRIGGLSINDPVLRSTNIKKALPDDENQALLTLYVAGNSLDSLAYVQLVDDFIEKFPDSSDGYVYRAQIAADGKDYDAADDYMAKALRVGTRQDEVHFSYSRMIYQTALYQQPAPAHWTFSKAQEEAEAAMNVRPMAIYAQQQAYALYAQQKYDEAYRVYEQLFDSVMLQPTLYYEASRCKEQLRDTTAQLALLDSAVNHFSKPYLKEAAPYLLARAQANITALNYRKAVLDLNDYEALMRTQVNANFYYVRFQAEVGGRLFQQALNDIDRAISMAPQSALYLAEKASLQVRVGQYAEAEVTAKECIRLAPDQSDGYLFLGLSQCLQGQKAEGVKNLQRAGELGDPQAAALIEKYSK